MHVGARLGLIGGSKEFPKVEATTLTNNSGGTSHNITLPSGIQSGDIILVFFAGYSTAGITTGIPAGYTRLYTSPSFGSLRFFETIYKIADGSEGGTTITCTTTSNTFATLSSLRISGGIDISASVTSASGSSNPNPPSHSPSWGSDYNLWIAGMAHSGFELSQSPPSEYSSNTGQSSYTSGGVDYARISYGSRNLIAASDDPNTFSGAPTGAIACWIATTIAVKPK